jgi:hypothetical protein
MANLFRFLKWITMFCVIGKVKQSGWHILHNFACVPHFLTHTATTSYLLWHFALGDRVQYEDSRGNYHILTIYSTRLDGSYQLSQSASAAFYSGLWSRCFIVTDAFTSPLLKLIILQWPYVTHHRQFHYQRSSVAPDAGRFSVCFCMNFSQSALDALATRRSIRYSGKFYLFRLHPYYPLLV